MRTITESRDRFDNGKKFHNIILFDWNLIKIVILRAIQQTKWSTSSNNERKNSKNGIECGFQVDVIQRMASIQFRPLSLSLVFPSTFKHHWNSQCVCESFIIDFSFGLDIFARHAFSSPWTHTSHSHNNGHQTTMVHIVRHIVGTSILSWEKAHFCFRLCKYLPRGIALKWWPQKWHSVGKIQRRMNATNFEMKLCVGCSGTTRMPLTNQNQTNRCKMISAPKIMHL